MRQTSVRTVMVLVLVSAVGLTALRNADDLWAGMMFLTALAAVLVAAMGAVILRGHDQFWCGGLAFCGAGYLLLAVGPWHNETFEPLLGTTLLLRYVHSRATLSPSSQETDLQSLQLERDMYLFKIKMYRREGVDAGMVSLIQQMIVDIDNKILIIYKDIITKATSVSLPAVALPNGTGANRWRTLLPGAENLTSFLRVGHSLFALFAGLLGGWLASWLRARRERGESVTAVT
jgi:hypothetical protein